MKSVLVATLALLAVAAGCDVADPAPGDRLPAGMTPPPPTVTELSYDDGPSPHPQRKLDFYAPPASFTGPRPLIVFVPGGSWIGLQEGANCGGAVGPCFPASEVARGYAVASLDYRTLTMIQGPPQRQYQNFAADQVADIKLAISKLRDPAIAALLNIDPDKVVVVGKSAGGHLAALAALSPGQWEPPGVSRPSWTASSTSWARPTSPRGARTTSTSAWAGSCQAAAERISATA